MHRTGLRTESSYVYPVARRLPFGCSRLVAVRGFWHRGSVWDVGALAVHGVSEFGPHPNWALAASQTVINGDEQGKDEHSTQLLMRTWRGAPCMRWPRIAHAGRRLLGVRMSTANHMVLAELGRFPLQILRYHHKTIALDNVRLVKLAMVDGFALNQTAVKDSWQHYLGGFLHGHLGQQQLFRNMTLHLS